MDSFIARANYLFVTRIFRRAARWEREKRGGSRWNKTKQGYGPVWGMCLGGGVSLRHRGCGWACGTERPEFFAVRVARMGKRKTLARMGSGGGQAFQGNRSGKTGQNGKWECWGKTKKKKESLARLENKRVADPPEKEAE